MTTLVLILVSILIYHLSSNVFHRKVILSITSLWVYYTFVEWYVALIPVMACVTYLLHQEVLKGRKVKHILFIHCLFLIAGLLLMKYGITSILMPAGYSIMAFSSISVICDGYRKSEKHSFLDILCFISFFSKILAGPLERINALTQQYDSRISAQSIYIGMKHIVFGLFGKYIIADNIANTLIFDNGCLDVIMSTINYAIMFYMDFWSYCNIAIGGASLYGITLSQNFCSPYSATSFRNFWKRWNITLTSWLRDYVYIPLGGNRTGMYKQLFNVHIVFMISALWHGVSIPFLIWGLLHAGLYSAECLIQRKRSHDPILYRVLVLMSVCMLWQMFRFDTITDLVNYLWQFCEWKSVHVSVAIACASSILCLWYFDSKRFQDIILAYPRHHLRVIEEIVLLSLMAICLVFVKDYGSSPFIYFSF